MLNLSSKTRCFVLMFAAFSAGVLVAAQARAALVLSVDPVAMTYRLTGSTTLDPYVGDDSDFALWGIDAGSGFGAVTPLDAVLATSSPSPLALTRLELYDNATRVLLDYGTSFLPGQEITGNGVAYSYAGASPTQQAYLQSILGQSLSPMFGLVADPIAVVSVPEPGSLALLGICGAALLRRRRQFVHKVIH